jgi:RNA polymerase primary sigma factor
MNTRFSTYASYWIKQSIKRALVNTAKTIRIPAYMVELLAKWRRANNQLTDKLGRVPTHEEIAKELGESSPNALTITKRLLAECRTGATAMSGLARESADARLHIEAKSGLKAFLEKKPVPWVK